MAEFILKPVFTNMRKRVGNIALYQRAGKHYAGTYVIARNPDTGAQRKIRTSYSGAAAAWQALQTEEKLFRNRLSKCDSGGRIIYSADKIPAAAEVTIQRLLILKLLQFSFKIFLSLIKIC